MNYLVFDTETSGFNAKDEVLQFSGLLLDEDLKLKKLVNFYCYTQVPINPKAAKVNNLTADKLVEWSGGKAFEDYFLNSESLWQKDLTWIGYNINFDTRMINQTLRNNGLPEYDFGSEVVRLSSATEGHHKFDLMRSLSMKNGGNIRKLEQLAQSLSYGQNQIDSMYSKLLKLVKNKSGMKFHDALYDSLVTWLLLTENREWCV